MMWSSMGPYLTHLPYLIILTLILGLGLVAVQVSIFHVFFWLVYWSSKLYSKHTIICFCIVRDWVPLVLPYNNILLIKKSFKLILLVKFMFKSSMWLIHLHMRTILCESFRWKLTQNLTKSWKKINSKFNKNDELMLASITKKKHKRLNMQLNQK
jgi:hypothetical protein